MEGDMKKFGWLILIILLVLGFWGWKKGKEVRREKEFIHNVSLANKLFEEKNYKESLNLYKTLLPKMKDKDKILYRMGFCSYKINDFAGARNYWEKVSPFYKDKVTFYELVMKLNEGKWKEAREGFLKWLENYPENPLRKEAEEKLEKIHEEMIYGKLPFPGSFIYEVKKGDSLYKIAKKFNTTVELLMRENKLKSILIKPKDKIMIIPCNFSIEIDLDTNLLYLYYNGKFFKVYPVATGKDEKTPVGKFKVTDRLKNPVWYSPDKGPIPPGDPRNLLGSRWIGISAKGIGIHESVNPEDVGKSVTNGCIRMSKKNVEELYMLIPSGSPVTIKRSKKEKASK